MENRSLENYIEAYYEVWHNYASYICRLWHIGTDAYDVLMDSLLRLISKDRCRLDQIIQREQDSNGYLCNYVKVMIRGIAAGYVKSKASLCSIVENMNYTVSCDDNAEQEVDELECERRILEAQLRMDNFTPPAMSSRNTLNADIGNVGLSVYQLTKTVYRKDGTASVRKWYRAEIYFTAHGCRKVQTKDFPEKEDAVRWGSQYRRRMLVEKCYPAGLRTDKVQMTIL